MENPMISVLMAVYNCEETLSEAINCIINQTYSEWELIIIDDFSTDKTFSIAKLFAKNDNRIKLYKNEQNLTLAPTLNKCLTYAKGEYIARMDGDDICALDRFEKELIYLKNHPEYALVSCQMDLFDDSGVYGTVHYKEKPQKEDFAYGSPICHAGCMMRKEVLEELGGYDTSPEKERIEDYDLWIRMYKAGYKAYNLQEVLYSMRDDRNAIKRKKFKFRLTEHRLKKKACKDFDLPFKCKLLAYKPIALGLLPSSVYSILHRKKYNK
jgi:glycosyltransferase EpsE